MRNRERKSDNAIRAATYCAHQQSEDGVVAGESSFSLSLCLGDNKVLLSWIPPLLPKIKVSYLSLLAFISLSFPYPLITSPLLIPSLLLLYPFLLIPPSLLWL